MKISASALLAVFLGCFAVPVSAASHKIGADSESSKAANFSIEPIPSWVVPVKAEPEAALPRSAMHYTVIDEQTRVDKNSEVHYSHVERVVDDASGLATAAQIEAAFDPTFQTFTLHRLTVWRNGKGINQLDRKNVRLLQRETKLESQLYDGSITASIVLKDIRVGDRIEYAYSVRGANPVFNGKFVAAYLTSPVAGPAALYQVRVVLPAHRTINYRAAPSVMVTHAEGDGMREWVFRRVAAPQFRFDEYAPDSVYLSDMLQLSEFKNWEEVARWGSSLFEGSAAASPILQARAALIKAATEDPKERLRLALDFVQREVRYFGMEMGANAHRPSLPEKTIERRFGDCKDKTALLLALLREMGIPAAPVLVSTRYLYDFDAVLPSPLAFNHAIARVELDGKPYWLDGTRSYQTGPLDERQSIGLGKGLVLRPHTVELVQLPDASREPRIQIQEKISFDKFAEPPTLESTTTYFGETAEWLRESVANSPADHIESQLSIDYGRFYPSIHRVEPFRIEEVSGHNAVKLVQRFSVPNFFRFPEQRVLAGEVAFWGLVKAVRHPSEPNRMMPFRIRLPGIYRQQIDVVFPEDVVSNPSTSHFAESHGAFQYDVDYKVEARAFHFTAELALVRDAIQPDEWPSYIDKLNKLSPRFAGYVNVSAVPMPRWNKVDAELRAARSSRFNNVTSVQRDAKVRTLLLTAQLDGGRLDPSLRAEALLERGVQLDNLGKPYEAASDFEEALRLNPKSAKLRSAAAVNAFARSNDTRAAELAESALQLAPSDTSPHHVLAFVDYYAGKYAEASKHLLAIGRGRDDTARAYAALWLYLAARQRGEDGVVAAREVMPQSAAPRWPQPVVQLLTGTGDLNQALKAATEDTKDPSRLCELYFYLGEKYALDGDKDRAREYLQKSVDTGVVEFNEYLTSKRSLTRIGNLKP